MIPMRGALVLLAAVLATSCTRGPRPPAPRGAAESGGGAEAEALAASRCPQPGASLAADPADSGRVVDDFSSGGPLDGRSRAGAAFVVTEQFLSTAGARFPLAPEVE